MTAALQAQDSTEKLKVRTALADAEKSRAETSEKILKEFKELRDDGQSVTARDLNTMLYTINQPSSPAEREHEIGRRPRIWTAPHSMKPLPEN